MPKKIVRSKKRIRSNAKKRHQFKYKGTKEDELSEALKLSLDFSNNEILFLGGGVNDAKRRSLYNNCTIKIAGNHAGVDIYGDWNTTEFWEQIHEFDAECIVIDNGSESWLRGDVESHLENYLQEKKPLLIYDLERTPDLDFPYKQNFYFTFEGEHYAEMNVVVACSPKFPKSVIFLGEVKKHIVTERSKLLTEPRTNYEVTKFWKGVGEIFRTYDGAVQHFLELFLICVSHSSIGNLARHT